jgi:hypothetical protein
MLECEGNGSLYGWKCIPRIHKVGTEKRVCVGYMAKDGANKHNQKLLRSYSPGLCERVVQRVICCWWQGKEGDWLKRRLLEKLQPRILGAWRLRQGEKDQFQLSGGASSQPSLAIGECVGMKFCGICLVWRELDWEPEILLPNLTV